MYNGPKQWNKTDHFRYIVLSTIWMLCVACANTRAFDEEEEKKTHNNNNDNRRAIAKAIYSITITIQSIQMNRTIVNEIVRNTGHTFQFHQLSTVCKTMSHCHCSIDDDETFCCVYCLCSLSLSLARCGLERFSFQLRPIIKTQREENILWAKRDVNTEQTEQQQKRKKNISKIIWPCVFVNCDWHWEAVFHRLFLRILNEYFTLELRG